MKLPVDELPFLTAEVPGIGGRIKARPEDFVVEEVPLYEASGEGTHVYFRMEKAGLATMAAIDQLARALGRPSRDFGYAGLKDADAVTRQMVSIEHLDPARLERLSLQRIRILDVSRHQNKLKLGHLKGNRFTIRVRDVDPARVDDVREMLQVLCRRGVPNYFGSQRFGLRGDTWRTGRAMLRHEPEEAVGLMAGRPAPEDFGDVRKARELFEQGEYLAAAETWPYPFRNERRLCRAMAQAKGNARRALGAVDRQIRRLMVSAYQSHLFNQVVAARIDALDRLMIGDLAWRHPQGAVFRVEDLAREQARCDAFEISPTGPLFGSRMSMPDGPAGETEAAILKREGMTLDAWHDGQGRRLRGGRRPLRFQPHEVEVEAGSDDLGPYIETRFFLESGCYATTVLREICKTRVAPDGVEEGEG